MLVRSLKTICWIAVWSVWGYLGFGLYRELPRDLGPTVCKIPIAQNDEIIGFLSNEPKLVTLEETNGKKSATIKLWNARTGQLVSDCDGPPLAEFGRTTYLWNGKHGRLIFNANSRSIDDHDHPEFVCLDVRTGSRTPLNWKPLTFNPNLMAFHSSKPWLATTEMHLAGGKARVKVVVLDLDTGKQIWEIPQPQTTEISYRPNLMFVPLTDEIVVESSKHVVEFWTVLQSTKVVRSFTEPGMGIKPRWSDNGRLLWVTHSKDKPTVEVVDTKDDRKIYSNPMSVEREILGFNTTSSWNQIEISGDGRTVLRGLSDEICDVDSGMVLWRVNTGNWVTGFDPKGLVELGENRHFNWRGFRVNEVLYTVRDLRTGKVNYRCWYPTLAPESTVSGDRRLVVFDDGEVHELPPRVNWLLLAGVQAFLAMPLVLLWAFGCWRRRRRRMKTDVADSVLA